MRLLPSKSFVVQSRLSVERLSDRVAEDVEDVSWLRTPSGKQRFRGRVSREGFRIAPVGDHRQHIPLLAVACFEPSVNGTRIHVRLLYDPLTRVLAAGYALIFLFLAFCLAVSPMPGCSVVGAGLFVLLWWTARTRFRQHATYLTERIEELLGTEDRAEEAPNCSARGHRRVAADSTATQSPIPAP
jgi:hypothetical protein